MPLQNSDVWFITGCSTGFGRELAKLVLDRGFRAVITARDPSQIQDLTAHHDGRAFVLPLDVTDKQQVANAVEQAEQKFGRIDVLVNNAGFGYVGALEESDDAEVRSMMETNFFGALTVTQAMLPLLRKSLAGRIVNVLSGLGSLNWNADLNWEFAPVKLIGYCASKAALNMLTVQLARGLRETPIKVNASDPGYTATDLNGRQGFQTVAQGAAETVRLALLPADGPTGGFFATSGPDPW